MIAVLMLFLIPVGGGIPSGVLLAQRNHLPWPATMSLYFISDVILAFAFEPILRFLVAAGRKIQPLARAAETVRLSMEKTATLYSGKSAGPFALIMIAFGVDPMTGRAAALAAGHGFVAGWAIAIAGDMIYFAVVMLATLHLNSVLGNPDRVAAAVLVAMILVPVMIRRVKTGLQSSFFSTNRASRVSPESGRGAPSKS